MGITLNKSGLRRVVTPQYTPFTPFEEGGLTCSQCGEVLPHEAYLGTQKGPNFHVSGYLCTNCQYQYGTGTRFDWRRLAIPRSISYGVKS
jgi:hypothetical protein